MQSNDLLKDTIFEGLGINPTTGDRWVAGVPHDPRSKDLYAILDRSDYLYGGDYFQWNSGGDGDNGETLMYGLDRYFWARDHGTIENDLAVVGGPADEAGRPVAIGDILLFKEHKKYTRTIEAFPEEVRDIAFGDKVDSFLAQNKGLVPVVQDIISYLRGVLEPSEGVRFQVTKDRDSGESLLWVMLVGSNESLFDRLDRILSDFWVHLPYTAREVMGIDVQLQGPRGEICFTVQRLEKEGTYWYAYDESGEKFRLGDTVKPLRIGLQWRGLLPEGPFEVGDYVVSERYAPCKVQRVKLLRYRPGLAGLYSGQRSRLAKELHNVVTPDYQAPPEFFRHATPEEIKKAGLHHTIPTRFSFGP